MLLQVRDVCDNLGALQVLLPGADLSRVLTAAPTLLLRTPSGMSSKLDALTAVLGAPEWAVKVVAAQPTVLHLSDETLQAKLTGLGELFGVSGEGVGLMARRRRRRRPSPRFALRPPCPCPHAPAPARAGADLRQHAQAGAPRAAAAHQLDRLAAVEPGGHSAPAARGGRGGPGARRAHPRPREHRVARAQGAARRRGRTHGHSCGRSPAVSCWPASAHSSGVGRHAGGAAARGALRRRDATAVRRGHGARARLLDGGHARWLSSGRSRLSPRAGSSDVPILHSRISFTFCDRC
jgi:hypothetical protein